MKILKLSLIFFTILSGGCMSSKPFISEIENLDKPVGKEIIMVDDILSKYVSIGSKESEVVKFLHENNFEVVDYKGYKKCPEADKIYASVYSFRPNKFLPADYKIVGYFCLKDKKVNHIEILYRKHLY